MHDGQMRACGGWAMGSEEGGRGAEGEKKGEGRSRQGRPWVVAGGEKETHRRSRSRRFLRSPPPDLHITQLRSREEDAELATQGIVVVGAVKRRRKAKRRRGGRMINSQKYYWLMENILANRFSVKVPKQLSEAASKSESENHLPCPVRCWRNIAIQKFSRPFRGSFTGRKLPLCPSRHFPRARRRCGL
jgi:hypothetical protein